MHRIYFTTKHVWFFQALKSNNNKEWFNENKAYYLEYVDTPFKEFIRVILSAINAQNPEIDLEADDAIFRINRDLRFTADKSPYKLFKSALISAKGKRSKEEPGFYLEIGVNYVKISGGCFKLSKSEKSILESQLEGIESIHGTELFHKQFKKVITKNSIAYEVLLSGKYILQGDLVFQVMEMWRILNPIIGEFKSVLTGDSELIRQS